MLVNSYKICRGDMKESSYFYSSRQICLNIKSCKLAKVRTEKILLKLTGTLSPIFEILFVINIIITYINLAF